MKKILSALLAVVLLLTVIPPTFIGDSLTVSAENVVDSEASASEIGSYNAYFSSNSGKAHPEATIKGATNSAVSERDGHKGVLLSDGVGSAYTFNVETEGNYAVELSYVACKGNNLSVELELTVDGKSPFSEFNNLELFKLYRDVGEPKVDAFGNEARADQEEVVAPQTVFLTDSTGYVSGPLYVYLTKGSHTLIFTSIRGDVLIQAVTLTQPAAVPEFDKKDSSKDTAKNKKIIIEAETPEIKSSSMLYASCDKTSFNMSPYPNGKEKLNVLGGSNFSAIGQWIDYKFEVKEAGYYNVNIKFKQNVSIGMTSYRNIYIDGKIPYTAYMNVDFPYSTKWNSHTVSNEKGEAIPVWLDKGEHTIRLEVTLGDYNEILAIIQDSVKEFNKAYLESIMYLTTSPDANRDYDVEKNLPNVLNVFEKQVKVLEDLSDRIDKVSGGKNDSIALVDRMVYQLNNILEKPETYPKRLEQVKSNVTALAALITTFSNQPLAVDYITVFTDDCSLKKAEANFFQNTYNEIINFLFTFSAGYNTTSTSEDNDDGIVVWVPSGRDQYKVIGNLIDNTFTPASKIHVNLKLVPVGSLLAATIANKGPDVVIQIANSEPMNYAVRGAVYDLNTFKDGEKITSRFSEAICEPLRLGKSLYALPETETFYMMFYRTDILKDLGLSVPKTWEDFLVVTTELQKNNLATGLPNTQEAFAMFLSQSGGSFYKKDTYECNINTIIGLKSFTKYTDMFMNYGLPLTYDALTRFRMGEMPLVINDYTFFNNLQVGAPEIANLWDFTIVPGTLREDGTINHTVPVTGTACMMLNSSKAPEKAWEFMKWWTSADAQISYGRDMEMILGTSGRVATANMEATKSLAWSKKNSNAIEAARKYTYGIENVPGSYFMSRHIQNAFRMVVLSGDDPKESLRYYSKIINNEIHTKCEELGISIEREQ